MRTRHTFVTAALGGMLALGAMVAPTTHAAAPAPQAAASTSSAGAADEAPDFAPANAPAGTQAVCDWDPDTNGYGGATVSKSIWLRSGPSSTCGANGGTLYVGQRLGGWCWYRNSAGNLWYYVSTGGAAPYGWIYGGNVTGEDTIQTECSPA